MLELRPNCEHCDKDLPNGGRGEWLCRNDGGLRVVSVFLRNTNRGGDGPDEPEQCLYQPEIVVRGCGGEAPIVNRAHRASKNAYDPDLESYRLLYRDKPEFAVAQIVFKQCIPVLLSCFIKRLRNAPACEQLAGDALTSPQI